MARPPKKGLAYFPKDTDYYDDFRIIDLSDKYGPLGLIVYDVIITLIYKNSYYIEMPLEKLSALVLKTIGNRWAKKHAVTQVILFCAEIGLLHHDLLSQGVITSVAVQRRYQEVTARNKVDKTKYWLIDDNGQPLVSEPEKIVSATETPVFATETPVSATEMRQIKENENKNKSYCYDSACARNISDDDKLNYVDKQGVVMLSETQIADLLEQLTLDEFNFYVERLADFIVKKNAHVKNHYSTILKWANEDRRKMNEIV